MKKITAVFLMVMMAVGFSWSFPRSQSDIVKITFKNQFPMRVSFFVNGKFACEAEANSSCSVQVDIRSAPFKFEVWGYDNTKVIAVKELEFLAPGKNVIWSTGNIELSSPSAPTPEQPAPTPASAAAAQAVPPVADIFFMTSVSTLNYQGREAQNRAQTVSIARIERQFTSTGAAYSLSGEGGLQVGKEGTGVFYDVSPVTVNRDAADRLSSNLQGLKPWLAVINGTLDGLTHKHMTSGNWDETLALSLGEGFPEKARVWFWARPLPEPDSHWILITADSGLLSFGALDPQFQDSPIYGRYRGVLVYSPTQDDFLQAAASFSLYHGEDQFRIEQLHYGSDAKGNQLHPGLDVGPYLNFAPEEPVITAPGVLPSWCVQAAHVLEMLHLAVMTAAEGATNQIGVDLTTQAMLNALNHESFLREVAKNNFWSKVGEIFDFAESQRPDLVSKPMAQLGQSLAENITPRLDPTFKKPVKSILDQKPLYYAAKKMINGRWYDIQLINEFPNPLAPPTTPPQTQPGKVKSPKIGKTPGAAMVPLLIVASIAGVVALVYLAIKILAGKKNGTDNGGNDFEIGVVNACTQLNVTSFKINGTEYGPINKGTSKTFKIKRTASCMRINCSYTLSNGQSYSDYGNYKTRFGIHFEDDPFFGPSQALVAWPVSDCS